MTDKVENANYPTISVAFEGPAVVFVAVDLKGERMMHVPVDVLGEAFGRTAAKVFDWCLLDQQATDCSAFGEPPSDREQVPSTRIMSMDHNGVFLGWVDEAGWGHRTIRLGAGAIRDTVDELVAAVRRALDRLLEP